MAERKILEGATALATLDAVINSGQLRQTGVGANAQALIPLIPVNTKQRVTLKWMGKIEALPTDEKTPEGHVIHKMNAFCAYSTDVAGRTVKGTVKVNLGSFTDGENYFPTEQAQKEELKKALQNSQTEPIFGIYENRGQIGTTGNVWAPIVVQLAGTAAATTATAPAAAAAL